MLLKKRGKKAIFFSLDALIALTIILVSLLVIFPTIKYSNYETPIPNDILTVLSTLKVGEINNSYVKSLISQGEITDLNKSILEQMGEFYVTNITLAKNLGDSILSELKTTESIGIWFEDKLISSKNSTSYQLAENIEVEKQIISGIKSGESVTGFSSRSFLSIINQDKYFYFGGYFGDGNISATLEYDGDLKSTDVELVVNKDFDLYINDLYSGRYQNSSSAFTPASYDLSAYTGNFQTGINTIKLVGDSLYVAGGFIKVNFENSSLNSTTPPSNRYNFPEIEGAINLYDGFYIPGTLNEMKIFLHYDSNTTTFMNIGNITVFNGSSDGETSQTINNAELSSILNYLSLSNKTIPLRLGLEGVNYSIGDSRTYDFVSVAPLPASFNSVSDNNGNTGVDVITYANRIFINTILGVSNTRIGLVGVDKEGVDPADYHNLSRNFTSLNDTLNNWALKGGVCLCCGINKAVETLTNESNSSNFRSVLVMADNEPTNGCGGSAVQDAIDSACNAWINEEISFDTIALGSNTKGQDMLRNISACANGTYYEGDYVNISDIYNEVAEDLLEIIFYEQTVTIGGNFFSKLFSDSYIEFNYTKETQPYGLVITSEEQFSDTYSGNFNLPPNSSILETRVISYSGPRWTNNVEINGISIYNLSSYNKTYLEIGDPYTVNIPNSFINNTNNIRLTTGIKAGNSTQGSQSNKIIYTIIKNLIAFSTISSVAEGCMWDIEFEDDTNITVSVPSNFSGSNLCSYKSSGISYDSNDAIQNSVYNLLKQLDFDSNNKLDVKFTAGNLVITSSEITGIPFSWSTEVQVRRWT